MKSALLIAILAAGTGLQAQSFKPLETVPSGTVPRGINFQGRLEEQGLLVTGQRPVRFRLYDALTGGNLLWDSMDNMGPITATLQDGVFGGVLDIPLGALTSSGDKYLETEVDGIVLDPREPLRSVPYARVAETIEGTVEISSGGLSVSNQSGVILFVSSITGQVGIGSSAFPAHPDTKLFVTGGDLTLGAASMSPASGAPDLFIPGNLSVEGSFVGGPAAGNSFQTVSVSTRINPGELFKVGAATMTVPEAGRVGLGVLSPAADLHLLAASVPGLVLDHATEPRLELRRAGTGVLRARHDGSIGRLGTVGATDLRLQANGADRLTVESGGEVGVGLSNPAAPLDVSGSANVSGALTLGTDLAVAEGGTGAGSAGAARTSLSILAQDGSNAAAGFPLFAIRISSTAAQAAAFENDPADCLAADFFPRGFDEAGTAQSCTDVSSSLDLSEATNEGRIYDGDNAVQGSSWAVTAAAGRHVNFDSDTFFIDVDDDLVGLGLTNPVHRLDVSGDVNLSAGSVYRENGSTVLSSSITGNAATATALAANGTNCSAGSAPLGLDASGAAEGCFDVATQGELDPHTGAASAHSAASANTASRIALRDGAGSFEATYATGTAQRTDALTGATADCPAGQYARGIGADGDAAGCASPGTDVYDGDNAVQAGGWTLTAAAGRHINLDSDTFFIDVDDDRLGIGVSGPTAALDVSGGGGDIRASSATLTASGGNVPNNCVTRQTALGAGALFATQSCNAGEVLLGGGGSCVLGNMTASRPTSITAWRIDCDGVGLHEVYARCCRQ